jgi:hypothetical protein
VAGQSIYKSPLAFLPLAVLIGLAGGACAMLAQVWSTGHEEINQKLIDFDRVRSIASFKTSLEQLNGKSAQAIVGDLFLAKGTSAIVSAQLLGNLKQMSANRGLEVLRAEDLPAKTVDALTLVGGSLDLSGTMAGVYGLVQDIENAKPFLFVEKLDLHANGPAGNENIDTILNVSLQVYGAVRADSSALEKPVQ